MQNEERCVTLSENYKNSLPNFGNDLYFENHQPLIGILRREILILIGSMLKLVWLFVSQNWRSILAKKLTY